MNRELVLSNLREAFEELNRTIAHIERDPSYGYGEFVVSLTHLYHHINTAWNARDVAPERAEACSQSDFAEWRQFPADLDLSV